MPYSVEAAAKLRIRVMRARNMTAFLPERCTPAGHH